ncbi:RNA12 protein-domain-containing protein [Geopyxis carbonaria]|nr:RNA12 protein-domain-containing protein [Geopyxis carbonaria]
MNRLLSPAHSWPRPRCVHPALTHSALTRSALTHPALRPRRSTGTIGVNKTGFIDTAPGESTLYFDNVFPLKTAVYDIRYLIMRYDKSGVESRIKKQCLPHPLRAAAAPADFTITSVVPRHKDGGAFVNFTSSDPAGVERTIQEYLKNKRLKPWFSPFTRVRTYLVRGKPWLEDLYRFPSARLRVEYVGGEDLSQEALYALFRRYGKIADIIVSPPGAKELPKSAVIQFLRMRAATSARNCLHGFTVPEMTAIAGKEGGVTLRIFYERTMKTRWMRDWVVKHPRIVLPLLAAVLAAVTVAVFDPVRTWFIKAKITHSLHFSENVYVGWLRDNTIGRFTKNQELEDLSALWDERKESVDKINGWLLESEETFIVVQGPRGSGKRELVVDSVLHGRKNVLIIDCEPINEAHGDSATITAAAAQVGYRPVFTWLNTISSLLDLAAQGTIGTSAGFSQTLENQFNKILQNTGIALKEIALEAKADNEKDAAMADDEYLSAHPERRPVVVIDNFLHMEGNSIIYERLSDWAALLVSANVAHIIFLTNDITFSKSLARSLPDRVFRSVFLGDARPESAKRYVLHHLDDDAPHITANAKALSELDDSIAALGGRLTDLEFLARRIKIGESPAQAVNEIIATSAAEILKLYFLEAAHHHQQRRSWTPEQAWYLVKRLADAEQLAYNEVLLNDLFRAGDEALQSLEQSEMIAIVNRDGRPYAIRPGKPVYRAAFRRLVEDRVLKAKMDVDSYKALIKIETATIKAAEEELAVLAGLEKKPKSRGDWLLARVQKSQDKIEIAEREVAGLKKVLAAEF